jgi:membrane fusion protein (multidrug efflux system)
MKRTWLVLFLVIAVLAILKIFFFPSAKQQAAAPAGSGKQPSVPVTAVVIRPVKLDQSIVATGSVRANEDVDLHPEVAGKLIAIRFKEGSPCQEGGTACENQ